MTETFPNLAEGVFTNKFFYYPGEKIHFHAYWAGKNIEPVLEVLDLKKRTWRNLFSFGKIKTPVNQNSPEKCTPTNGCRWDQTIDIVIPPEWETGIYRFSFLNSASEKRFAYFILGNRTPKNSVLYYVDFQTPCAYNIYGNASFYGTVDQNGRWTNNGVKTYSCWRPLVIGYQGPEGKAAAYPPAFEATPWLWTPNFLFDMAADNRVEFGAIGPGAPFNIKLLEQYEAIVLNGSFEYLSKQQTEAFKDYVQNGGKLVMNAREFSYGMVELNPKHQRMKFIGFRHDLPHLEPVHNFFGVSVTPGRWMQGPDKRVSLNVSYGKHPLFKGLNLKPGDALFKMGPLALGGWVQKEPSTKKQCLVAKNVNCDNSIVLAHAPWVLDNGNTSAVIALVKQGKGYILTLPGIYFSTAEGETMKKIRKRILPYILKLKGLYD